MAWIKPESKGDRGLSKPQTGSSGESRGGVRRSVVEHTKVQTHSQRTRPTPSAHEVNECERVTWGWMVLYSNFTLYIFLNLNETRCLQEMLLIEAPVLRGDSGFCSLLTKLEAFNCPWSLPVKVRVQVLLKHFLAAIFFFKRCAKLKIFIFKPNQGHLIGNLISLC